MGKLNAYVRRLVLFGTPTQKRLNSSKVGPSPLLTKVGFTIVTLGFIGIIYTLYNLYLGETSDIVYIRNLAGRSSFCDEADDEDSSSCPEPAEHWAMVFVYSVGTLYFFVAIAIVCDELFVPALEEIAAAWDMSDDVAGATLMAAGGSAPELATSLIGTFSGSDVGFGTIVGSAVFNVLFVIACCVLWTPKEMAPLELTGWPLGRDCLYYAFTLIMVSVMFGFNTPGVIEAWEACFLFALYFGYIIIMKFNEDLQNYFSPPKILSEQEDMDKEDRTIARKNSITYPSNYRAGFFHLISQDAPLLETAGVSVVFKIKGDVKEVFDQLDADKSGTLEANEIKTLLEMLTDTEVTDEIVADVMNELDIDKNGLIDFAEFTVWYVKSEQRLQQEEKHIFQSLDSDMEGFVKIANLGHLLTRLQVKFTKEQLDDATKHFEASKDKISWEEFSDWFEHSPFWAEKIRGAEMASAAAEGIWGDLYDFPKETTSANVVYLVMAPITWTLALTAGIKDVRIPGNGGWCFYQFFLSIIWIGVYAYLLVDWVTIIGATLGVPEVVMGLTVLAAGTSVPDLLSSMVVARAGKGDMAVSSSIGSNIFDVTVGLPVPWILFNIFMDCPVIVGADNLVVSVLVLLVMVILVVCSVMATDWKMTHRMGAVMMVLYVVFVVQDVTRVYVSGSQQC
jgi:K+-dependent Na+/Ca+ exchanger-like protein